MNSFIRLTSKLEMQGWTHGIDSVSDSVMTSLLAACP